MYDFSGDSEAPGARLAAAARTPSRSLLALEFPRWMGEYATSRAIDTLSPRAAEGAGRPVLVLPGFSATDQMTGRLRDHLRRRGYSVHGWGQGRNIGLTDELVNGLVSRFEDVAGRYDEPVSVVGWSFGGLLARWLAHTHAANVRQVVALGSPWRAEGERTRATAMFERSRRKNGISDRARDIVDQLRAPVPVPTTAVWSKSDGIVPWRGCRVDPSTFPVAENVEIVSSHVGLVASPLALAVTADRLAQSPENWKAFSWVTCVGGQVSGRRR